jgi:transposase InsO family protein
MCKVLKVSRSSYYCWLTRNPSRRSIENRDLSDRIRKIYDLSKRTYGSPRVTIKLQEEGFHVSRPRVARLMKKQNLKSIIRKKWVITTDSRHNYPVVENRLNRDFNVTRSGQVWVSDITYIKTSQGWLYLTVIIDLYDRKVLFCLTISM